MATKLLIIITLLSLYISTVQSQSNKNYPCIEKLLPCSQYLKTPKPPAACCIPLKEAIDKDAACLCDLFSNQQLLKTFNVTQDEALQLPKNCGVNADLDKCKKSNGGKVTPPTPTPTPPNLTPPTPTPPTPPPVKSASSSSDINAVNAAAIFAAISFVYLSV
ncbi:lipid transfer-like protein VAS [Asparagus officinalis]|uniref:lipid transfer-like protein VAS n=1 Tax=Asparagus officinalis TaxID=4686 RepID=UPI00098DF9EE|nr:lipid transfer-like protein VAS [Asparagus officinalis]